LSSENLQHISISLRLVRRIVSPTSKLI
jgi:hypothetical protein